MELPGVYPNGIAFDTQQRLYWTESMAHRVRRMENGEPATFCQLSDEHVPDGMAFAADGRLFVATTVSQGVTVISAEGDVLEEIRLGEHATNCIFDGPALYVTATREADIEASARTGTFWRVDTDAPGGLDLIPGRLQPPGHPSRPGRGRPSPGGFLSGRQCRRVRLGGEELASSPAFGGHDARWNGGADAGQRLAEAGAPADQDEQVAVPGELLHLFGNFREQQPGHLGRVGIRRGVA